MTNDRISNLATELGISTKECIKELNSFSSSTYTHYANKVASVDWTVMKEKYSADKATSERAGTITSSTATDYTYDELNDMLIEDKEGFKKNTKLYNEWRVLHIELINKARKDYNEKRRKLYED